MSALSLADKVYIGAVARAGSLKDGERFDTAALLQFLQTKGVEGYTAPTNRELLALIKQHTNESADRPQLVIFFTNGSFDGIIGDYVESVE